MSYTDKETLDYLTEAISEINNVKDPDDIKLFSNLILIRELYMTDQLENLNETIQDYSLFWNGELEEKYHCLKLLRMKSFEKTC